MIISELTFIQYDCEYDRHSHDYHQWVFPIRGELELRVSGEQEHLIADHIAFLNKEVQHEFKGEGDNLFAVLNMSGHYKLASDISIVSQVSDRLLYFMKYLRSEVADNTVQRLDKISVQSLLQKFVLQYHAVKRDALIEKAMHWIEQYCIHEELTLDSVASAIHLSASQLQRRFKATTNMTVMAYVRQVRIRKAQMLLKQTDLPLAIVANNVGYQDTSAFCRQFSGSVGMSPIGWRKMQISA